MNYRGQVIEECRPPTIFGEQVASAVTHGWLDDVYEGLEAQGYAIGAAVLSASSIGAPHKRDRLWFVGDSQQYGQPPKAYSREVSGDARESEKGEVITEQLKGAGTPRYVPEHVADTDSERLQGHRRSEQGDGQEGWEVTERHPWSSGVWIDCPDTKQRLVEPSIPLLAHGVQHRKPILHALGNAIVPQVAVEFINAFIETEMERQELKQSINEGVK